LALLPEILKNRHSYLGDDFVELLGVPAAEDPDGIEVCRRAAQVAERLVDDIIKRRIGWMQATAEWDLGVAVYQEDESPDAKRWIILPEGADETDTQKGLLSAVNGLNYEQIEFLVTQRKSICDFEAMEERPDIWHQFIYSLTLHAVGQLPEVKVWGWDRD